MKAKKDVSSATLAVSVAPKSTRGKKAVPQDKIEFNLLGDKIGTLKVIQRSEGFRDSFSDGPVWRDTFADGGNWLSNFNNMGADQGALRHPAVQGALEKLRDSANQALTGKIKKT